MDLANGYAIGLEAIEKHNAGRLEVGSYSYLVTVGATLCLAYRFKGATGG